MTEKIIGYSLIVIGVVTIILSSISVYNVFTKKERPVNLFAFSGISMDPSVFLGGNPPQGMSLPKNAKIDLMTPEMINESSNIFAHVVLMGFLASAGLKLATIGTQLVRTIDVKIRTKETISS